MTDVAGLLTTPEELQAHVMLEDNSANRQRLGIFRTWHPPEESEHCYCKHGTYTGYQGVFPCQQCAPKPWEVIVWYSTHDDLKEGRVLGWAHTQVLAHDQAEAELVAAQMIACHNVMPIRTHLKDA